MKTRADVLRVLVEQVQAQHSGIRLTVQDKPIFWRTSNGFALFAPTVILHPVLIETTDDFARDVTSVWAYAKANDVARKDHRPDPDLVSPGAHAMIYHALTDFSARAVTEGVKKAYASLAERFDKHTFFMDSGVSLIVEERAKQEAKYSAVHDDKWTSSQLETAARCLLKYYDRNLPWPFESSLPRFEDAVGRLKIAGAFIAAEIDRLQRLRVRKSEPDKTIGAKPIHEVLERFGKNFGVAAFQTVYQQQPRPSSEKEPTESAAVFKHTAAYDRNKRLTPTPKDDPSTAKE